MVITEPGIYSIPPEQYHADPVEGGSLTSSGARKLLRCPARFRHELDCPPAPTEAMEVGSAAHRLVLGVGPELVRVEAPDWRSSAARAERDRARAEGKIPLLAHQHDAVHAMAARLREHPLAGALLRRPGKPEQTLVWRDSRTGVRCRAMVDYLSTPRRRLILVDYKTTSDASDDGIRSSVARYGYHQQAAWYCAGVRALGLSDDPAFLFIFQEKEPPYLARVVELDRPAMEYGEQRNRRALEIYRECVESGRWPGYSDKEITLISLPEWAYKESE